MKPENDEKLAAVLHDWWWNEPLAGLEEGYTDEAAAMADMRSLLQRLKDNGYAIVKTPVSPGEAFDLLDAASAGIRAVLLPEHLSTGENS